MANVVALVSRAGFDALEKAYGSVELGRVVPVDRYVSAHATFQALAQGGALHLVTVRLPDERLWLVAVLRNPTFDGEKWVAEANTVPVRDVTDLLPELRAQSGKSLAAAPGKLAMSLQTPRLLDDASAVLLAGAEHPSPGAAYHAAVIATLGGTGGKPSAKAAPPPAPPPLRDEPLPWTEALADIVTWRTLGDRARAAALEGVVAALGDGFAAGSIRCGRDRLATVTRDGLEYVVVPGGRYAKGYTLDDLLAVWRALPVGGDDDTEPDELRASSDAARPPKDTLIRPFLASRAIVGLDSLRAAAALPDAPVPEVLARLGWRLPSEAEWEWFAREGGAVRFVGVPPGKHPLGPSIVPCAEDENGWGLTGLLNEENLCQDGQTRMGHTWWQSETEVIGLHAATRMAGTSGDIRLCRDIPGAVATSATLDWAAQAADLLAALAGKGKDRERALRALTCADDGPDLEVAMAALADSVDRFDPKVLPNLAGRLYLGGATGRARAAALLDHADAKVRAAAAFALGHQPTPDERLRLRARLAVEKKAVVAASIAFALADDAIEPLLRHKELLVRTAALLALAPIRPFDHAAYLTLAEATGLPREGSLPWLGGDLASAALAAVANADGEVKGRIVEALVGRGGSDALEAALGLAFGPAQPGRPSLRDPEALDGPQRRVLETFADGATGVDISSWGLPTLPEDLRRWTGREPPGAMEERVTWNGVTAPFWRHATELHRVAASESWDEGRWIPTIRPLLDALDPSLRVRIAIETGRYRLAPQTENRWGLPWPPPAELVAGADPVATRAAIEARIAYVGATPRWVQRLLELWVATLASGEHLPERLYPHVVVGTIPFPPTVVAAIRPEDQERVLMPSLAVHLARARPRAWFSGGATLLRVWMPLLGVAPRERIAFALLQLEAAKREEESTFRATVAELSGEPGVAAALARFDAFGDVTSEEGIRRLLAIEV